jgi:hypothetical protein
VTQPLRVDVSGLRALGGSIVQEGDELKRDLDAVTGQLAPGAGPGVEGWAAFASLGGAARGWTDFLSGLSGRVQAAGQSVVKAADDYRGVDDRASQRHGRVQYR